MTVSPYIDRPARSLAETIRNLETKLSRTVEPVERQRIERALAVLRDELARQP